MVFFNGSKPFLGGTATGGIILQYFSLLRPRFRWNSNLVTYFYWNAGQYNNLLPDQEEYTHHITAQLSNLLLAQDGSLLKSST